MSESNLSVLLNELQATVRALEREMAGQRHGGLAACQIARTIIANRRARHAHFGHRDLFGEPAWDMLLDIYVRQTDGERISVKCACIAAEVPATTALRYLNALEESGLICSEADPRDNRRRFVSLSVEGYATMTCHLNSIA